jgi:hypothetical protein
MQHEAMFRRAGLWFGLNAMTSLTAFVTVAIIRRRVHRWVGWEAYNGLHFTNVVLYSLAFIILALQTFAAYSADKRRYGSTNIRFSALHTIIFNSVQAGVCGFLFGACLLSPDDFAPLSLTTIMNVFRNKMLVSLMAAKVSFFWYLQIPPRVWPLQEEPANLFMMFGKQLVDASRIALPRSTVISLSIASVFVLLRTVEHIYFSWMCHEPVTATLAAAAAAPAVCSALGTGILKLPMYMPTGSVWSAVSTGFFVSFVVSMHLHVLTESLSYVCTYPLDFRKLQAQLVRSGGGAVKESDIDAGNNEQLLVRALSLGLESILKPNSASGSTPTSSSVGYTERTAIAGAEEQNRCHALLVRSIVVTPEQPAALPYFGEVSLVQPTAAVGVKAGPGGGVVATSSSHIRITDLLSRALAFQDLYRVASERNGARRAAVYAKHWSHVIGACLGMVDAAALQVRWRCCGLTIMHP